MKKRVKRSGTLARILLFFGCLLGLAGCSNQNKELGRDKPYVVGIVTKSRDSEYWMSICSGIEKAAADRDISVFIVSPDSETDESVQKKMIDDLLDKGIDALAISPINSYDYKDYLDKAKRKKIPVFSYDTRIMDPEVPYIGIDNKKAGEELAKYMAEKLGNEGKIGIISGNLNQTSHESRLEGFRSYIKDHTQIEISFIESGYSNLQMSEHEISRLMEENPGISGIFATSAVTALGIMEYMKNQPVMIVTVDAQEDAMEAVKNGGISVLAAQSGYDIGYETIEYIAEAKEGKRQNKEKIIEMDILTKENTDDYEKTQR